MLTGERMKELFNDYTKMNPEDQKGIVKIVRDNTGQADANAFQVAAIFRLTDTIKKLDAESSKLSTRVYILTWVFGIIGAIGVAIAVFDVFFSK